MMDTYTERASRANSRRRRSSTGRRRLPILPSCLCHPTAARTPLAVARAPRALSPGHASGYDRAMILLTWRNLRGGVGIGLVTFFASCASRENSCEPVDECRMDDDCPFGDLCATWTCEGWF